MGVGLRGLRDGGEDGGELGAAGGVRGERAPGGRKGIAGFWVRGTLVNKTGKWWVVVVVIVKYGRPFSHELYVSLCS